ncbi:hypothetical protein LJC74_10395 [Eubacteriales bacterium OttesenSCG-928-A19]|nr:hypothetical protein [Eubacteriales bacterium OttesenSCG-928-A19]
MALYSRGRYERGFNRRTVQWIIVVACVLLALCIFMAIRLWFGSTSDTQLYDAFVERVKMEESYARTAAAQISRVGGSGTLQMLSETRQHLYALSMINDFSTTLLTGGQPMVPQSAIDTAVAALIDCESRILGSGTIDTPLNTLWEQLGEIATAADALR